LLVILTLISRMGVPKLFHSLIQQYHHNDVSNPTGYYIVRRDIDHELPIHLYFDFNSAVYQVIKPEIKTEDVLITHVVAYLDSLCNAIGKDKCVLVYIALDGVPPMGKIQQQRIRGNRCRFRFRFILKEPLSR
jgi:5'-3' exonuclease